jgi:hypothetical protein
MVPNNAVFADIAVRAELFQHIRLWGSVETYMTPNSILSYNPYRSDYVIGAAAYFGPFELGVRHECDHGVSKATEWRPYYMKTETQIYLSISGRLEF